MKFMNNMENYVRFQYINGCYYHHFHFNMDKDVFTPIEKKDVLKQEKHGVYRVTQYTYRTILASMVMLRWFYTFGFMDRDPQARPGHGGEWSSNCENIKREFKIDLVCTAMNSMAMYVDRGHLRQFLTQFFKNGFMLDHQETLGIQILRCIQLSAKNKWYMKDLDVYVNLDNGHVQFVYKGDIIRGEYVYLHHVKA